MDHQLPKTRTPNPSSVSIDLDLYEKGVRDRLWRRYLEFRRVRVPEIESKGELPIVPGEGIWGSKLKGYLENFINSVWKPALVEDEEREQKYCLYLGLCIWDCFRNESTSNWALIDPAVNVIVDQFDEYLEILKGKKMIEETFTPTRKERRLKVVNVSGRGVYDPKKKPNCFYTLYKYLVREIVIINAASNDCPTATRPFPEPSDGDVSNNIELSLGHVADCHQPFVPEKIEDGEQSYAPGQRYIYYIPSSFVPKDAGTGIGGLVLISTFSFNKDTLTTFQTVLDSILTKVGIRYLYGNFHDQSARSAISSIMARNMSHNLGSHVVPRATVDAVKRRLIEMKLWPTTESDLNALKNLKEASELLKREESGIRIISDLKGRLDEYTQRKSDFLAEITTEPLRTTRPAFFYRQVILPLVENTLFMDNIAANEGARYERSGRTSRLIIRVFVGEHQLEAIYVCPVCNQKSDSGQHYRYPDSLPYSLTCLRHKGVRLQINSIANGDHDVEVELPGPLGEFALYSFLENYIRNVAKHNKARLLPKEPLEINIRLDELDKDLTYYQIRIWNNVVNHEEPVHINVDGKIHVRLREAILAYVKSSIIHPDGSLKRQAWGIAEMKICASLLRGPQDLVGEIAGGRQSINILEDATVDRDARLVYDFNLIRSRNVCALLPSFKNTSVKNRLKEEGVWIFNSLRDLQRELQSGSSIASFRFALFDCTREAGNEGARFLEMVMGTIDSTTESLLTQLPFRMLLLADSDSSTRVPSRFQPIFTPITMEQISGMSGSEILNWLWSSWLRRWLKSPRVTAVVNLYLEQRGVEDPTKRWAGCAARFNESSDSVKLRVYESAGQQLVNSLCDIPDRRNQVNIIYDRHRGLRDAFEKILYESNAWSYILLEKNSPDFISLFSPVFPQNDDSDEPPEPWILPFELAEAGLSRVLVIDERAAEFSMDTLSDDTHGVIHGLMRMVFGSAVPKAARARKWHLAWAAKIYVCTHFGINTDAEPIHERINKRGQDFPYLKMTVRKKEIDFRMAVVENEITGLQADVVLIHQGVLDEWRARVGADFNQGDFLNILRNHFPFVVVESGRGIPPNLSANEKFLPFSLLQHNVFGDNVGKFGFNRILMSLSRRRGRTSG